MTHETEKNIIDTGTDATQDELVAWLKTGSKTLGYDAVVAFDRSTVNLIYQEQYLRRLSADATFPPIQTIALLINRTYLGMSGVEVGAPRVSFDVADISDEQALVRVDLPMVGGLETQLEYSVNNYRTLTRINPISILRSPNLTGVMSFEQFQQEGDVGSIAIDLKKAIYEWSLGHTQEERLAGGRIFHAEFEKWEDAVRLWTVNRIIRNTGPFAVKSFALRAQRKSATAVMGDSQYGEGAVVAFVEMEGSYTKPGVPSAADQFEYLIPEDGDFASTVLIKDVRLMQSLLQALQSSGGDRPLLPAPFEVAVTNNAAQVFSVAVSNGRMRLVPSDGFIYIKNSYYLKAFPKEVSLSSSINTLTINVERNEYGIELFVHIKLSGCIVPMAVGELRGTDLINQKSCDVKISSETLAWYTVGLNPFQQTVDLRRRKSYSRGYSCDPYQFNDDRVSVEDFKAKVVTAIGSYMLNLESSLAGSIDLGTFPLRSLLFGPPFTNRAKQALLLQDTAFFGRVAPDLIDFTITTPLHTMVAGGVHQFSVSTRPLGITWAVRNLKGQAFPTGSITQTGKYTAPSADQITGLQVRLIVTATQGTTTASALVTVAARSLDVSPLIQFYEAGAPVVCEIEVGTIGSATQTWTVDPQHGVLELVPGRPNVRRFRAPAVAPTLRIGLDVVPVTVTVDGISETAYVAVRYVAPTMFPVVTSMDTAGRTAQFALASALPTTTWDVACGSATIDSNGRLLAGLNPYLPFALVTAEHEPAPGYPPMWGYALLGLPLAPFPPEPPASSAQTQLLLN